MRALLLLLLVAVGSVPLSAQRLGPEQRRPKLAADADTNDASAYLAHGVRSADEAPDLAAAAFYWAARLDPSSADALYGLRVASLMRKPTDLSAYIVSTRRARENKKFLQLDSLQLRALRLNPLFHRRLDYTMIMAYYRYAFKDDVGSMSRREFEAQINEILLKEPPAVRADVMYGQGRLDQALIEYEDAIRVSRFPIGLRLDRARVYAMKGDLPKALAEFGTTLGMLKARDEKKDGFVIFYDSKALVEHSIGLLHARAGSVDSAKAAFGRAMTEDLAYFPAHVELGRLALEQKDTVTAVSELALAADLAADEPYVHYLHGGMLVATGQHAEAVAPLKKAIDLEPLYAAPHAALGTALERTGDKAAATAAYERFLVLAGRRDPQRNAVTQRLGALKAAR